MQDRNSYAASMANLPRKCEPMRVAELLARVSERDAEAFSTLYRVSAPTLFGLALRMMRKREWAEDVLQDSFIKIWRFAYSYDPGRSSAMTWMATIVKNQARDELSRTPPPTDELPGDFFDVQFENVGPDAALQRVTDVARLSALLQQLSPMQRQAIALAYFRGQTHAEIADTLAVPAGTVKSWIRRALRFLKTQLEGADLRADPDDAFPPLEIADVNPARAGARSCARLVETRQPSVTLNAATLDGAHTPL
jgi:RNA polymerase sigma-70 factor (ECF subfamily)